MLRIVSGCLFGLGCLGSKHPSLVGYGLTLKEVAKTVMICERLAMETTVYL